jgi:hypothetical protein
MRPLPTRRTLVSLTILTEVERVGPDRAQSLSYHCTSRYAFDIERKSSYGSSPHPIPLQSHPDQGLAVLVVRIFPPQPAGGGSRSTPQYPHRAVTSSTASIVTRIALIGAGNIGSRYLQGLSTMDRPSRVDVIDPYPGSLELSRKRFEKMPANAQVTAGFQREMPRGAEFDIAIVATTSGSRRSVVEELMSSNDVRYLILEKFLFQTEPDYDTVSHLLTDLHVSSWVNCPRRVWSSYKQLKPELSSGSAMSLSVTGGRRFPIGTTAIHFLDLLAWLTGQTDFELTSDDVDRTVLTSPRQGHIEFTGKIKGVGSGGERFEYSCLRDERVPLTVTISSQDIRVRIDEDANKAEISHDSDDHTPTTIPFSPETQSGLIASVVTELLDSGHCGLPALVESIPLHLSILRALLPVWREVNGPTDTLPIT